MANRTCIVAGCTAPPRSGSADLCNKHYFRKYRHGDATANWATDAIRVSKGRRYRSAHLPQHPLAGLDGRVYVHRAVLFDEIGYGPHLCFWCGTTVTWGGRSRTSLFVDHLDGYGDNNDPTNLVASCPACNTRRATTLKHAANAGQWWNGDGADAVLRTLGRSRV